MLTGLQTISGKTYYLDEQGKADQSIKAAHDTQTDMLTKEAQGEHAKVDLYMVHAQDHVMNGITFRDLAVEMIAIYQKITDK